MHLLKNLTPVFMQQIKMASCESLLATESLAHISLFGSGFAVLLCMSPLFRVISGACHFIFSRANICHRKLVTSDFVRVGAA